MDIRIAAYGVIIRDDLMLLAHWNEHGMSGWTLPGGGIDLAKIRRMPRSARSAKRPAMRLGSTTYSVSTRPSFRQGSDPGAIMTSTRCESCTARA